MIGGAGTKNPVPEVAPGVECWGINNLIYGPGGKRRFAHCTHWFDLHHRPHIEARRSGNMWGEYRRLQIPLLMWERFPDLPTSEVYPHEAVREMFGGTRLFTSSLDWMVALALYRGVTEIELYAFRMTHPNYQFQVGSGRWWLKQCADRGVKVTHLSYSTLNKISREVEFKPPRPESKHLMYGLETTDRSKLYRGR